MFTARKQCHRRTKRLRDCALRGICTTLVLHSLTSFAADPKESTATEINTADTKAPAAQQQFAQQITALKASAASRQAQQQVLYQLFNVTPVHQHCIKPAIFSDFKLGTPLAELSARLHLQQGEWQLLTGAGISADSLYPEAEQVSARLQARYPKLSQALLADLLPIYQNLVKPPAADWVYACAQDCPAGMRRIRVSVDAQARITAYDIEATVTGPDARRHRFEGLLFSARAAQALECGVPLNHPHLNSVFCYYESAASAPAARPALSVQVTDSQLHVRYECEPDARLLAALHAHLAAMNDE